MFRTIVCWAHIDLVKANHRQKSKLVVGEELSIMMHNLYSAFNVILVIPVLALSLCSMGCNQIIKLFVEKLRNSLLCHTAKNMPIAMA